MGEPIHLIKIEYKEVRTDNQWVYYGVRIPKKGDIYKFLVDGRNVEFVVIDVVWGYYGDGKTKYECCYVKLHKRAKQNILKENEKK